MAAAQIRLRPVETSAGLKDKVYSALKIAITAMDIYSGDEAPRLDERRLAEDLGVSRTPIREALSRLAQDGLVEMIPRKGAFVARKNKREILEIISVWAALESMAARLATQVATDEEIGQWVQELYELEASHGVGAVPAHAVGAGNSTVNVRLIEQRADWKFSEWFPLENRQIDALDGADKPGVYDIGAPVPIPRLNGESEIIYIGRAAAQKKGDRVTLRAALRRQEIYYFQEK